MAGSVQNQEVQLKCDFIRIGSMRYKSVDTVRIRKDWQNSGIYFKVLSQFQIVTFVPVVLGSCSRRVFLNFLETEE